MPRYTDVVGTPATPQFAETKLVYPCPFSSGSTYPVTCIFHFRRIGDWVATTKDDITNAVFAALDSALIAMISSSSGVPLFSTRFMDDPTDAFGTEVEGNVGGVTGDRLPLFNALYIQLRSDVRGRSYNGSKHFAPLGEADTTLDQLTGGAATRAAALADAINDLRALEPVTDSNWKLTIISPTLSNLAADPAVFTGADVTLAIASPVVGTMRRRKEKRTT